MSLRNKIIWTEGMFLRPQHFQQQDRHFEAWVENRCSGLTPHAWGISELQVDKQLLSLGKFAIVSCSGVFPDGTPFRIPEDQSPPAPLDIPVDKKSEVILISLPIRRTTGSEVATDDEADILSRYRKKETQTRDFHSNLDGNDAAIELGEMWTRLRFASEDQGAHTSIPIVKLVERMPDDLVVLDEDFITSSLNCSGSIRLSSYLQEIQGLLHHRADALANRLGSPGAGGVGEIVDFLLLQIVNRYEPLFNHFAELRSLHPEALYAVMIQMAGELATITQQSHRAPVFPTYRHEDLTATFVPVITELRKSLNWVPEARAISIPLEEHKFGVKTAAVHDKGLLSTAEFILAVNAQVSTEKLHHNFPHQTTISTVEKLRDHVMTHTPGVEIRNLAVAPRQIPFHSGFSYFAVDKKNEMWDEIQASGTIAMHFSGDYPGLEIELWAIRQ
jgi:type VI secretion system protein ImpJ